MRLLKSFSISLHAAVSGLLVFSALTGSTATFLWMDTERRWDNHLQKAKTAGILVFWSQQTSSNPPNEVSIKKIAHEDAKLATAGKFSLISSVNSADFVTQLSLTGTKKPGEQSQIHLAITSPDLKYPIGKLTSSNEALNQTLATKLGQVFSLLASYCSNATIYMKREEQTWIKISANSVWSCSAAPSDYRLFAVALLALSFLTLVVSAKSITLSFSDLATKLLKGSAMDRPHQYVESGPSELRALIRGINHFLSKKSDSLERRAQFLSGVSHDLGTPATRLRLRTKLIEDTELRRKIDNDIEAMVEMIETVLSYTQSEINIETKRRVSLLSIVQTIVTDFQDDGYPVTLSPYVTPKAVPRTLLFNKKQALNLENSHKRGSSPKNYATAVAVMAQPLAITRAITNLVDNALKYGRRANLTVEADLNIAKVHVDDFGTESDINEIEKLIGPFRRGSNSKHVKGFGIGLAVASTVAEQHGGQIQFEKHADGLRATLCISRNE